MASCSSPNDAIRLETAFIRQNCLGSEMRLTFCSIFRQTLALRLLPFAGGSQSAVEEFGGGAELGKYEVRSKNYES